ncbi:MAG: PDZ domain-containing protein [Planctomycetes bacterium]|nr:PDZ domain-containing protein [Planctomycetota bacterium]
MDRFVCVRLVRAETLDLALFDFDPDLSFAVFFIDADQTIYGRYGSRSSFAEAERDVSLDSLQKAMESALEWHAKDAEAKGALAGKRGATPEYRKLADFPREAGARGPRRGRGPDEREGEEGGRRRRRDEEGRGGRCSHCHDLGNRRQLSYLARGEPIPDDVLFAWPMPAVVGLDLDPRERATIRRVVDASAAAKAGFREGDEIRELQGQPIFSIADRQWVLQNTSDAGRLEAKVERGGEPVSIALDLESGWRRKTDISWRTTTRVLRSRLLGGYQFREATDEERSALEIPAGKLALKAARGRRGSSSPLQRGDVIVAVDGKTEPRTESDLIGYFASHPTQKITLSVVRGEAKVELEVRVIEGVDL